MLRIAAIICFALGVTLPSFARAETPWFQRSYWATFDWSHPELSAPWKEAGPAAKDDGKSKYAEINQPPDVSMPEITFGARFVERRGFDLERAAILTADISDKEACRKTRSITRKYFGDPIESVSVQRSLGFDINSTTTDEQWTVGNTIITSTCIYMGFKEPVVASLVKFEDSNTAKRLTALVKIECDIGTAPKTRHLIFILDEYNDLIMRQDNSILDGYINENSVVVRLKNADAKITTVHISRGTGTITMDHEELGLLGTGKCAKVSAQTRAF